MKAEEKQGNKRWKPWRKSTAPGWLWRGKSSNQFLQLYIRHEDNESKGDANLWRW